MGEIEPVIALAVLAPVLGVLFFVQRMLPWYRPGPWRLVWLMATVSSLLFIAAEAAAISRPEASALTVEHQIPLFGAIAGALAGFVLVHRVGSRITARSAALALTDPLTGLANRRALEERLKILLERRETFALVYLDVDGLKAVNDGLGHMAGDQVLLAVAQILRRAARKVDTAARVGGDEFALVFPSANEDAASRACERILEIAAREALAVRLSLGVTTHLERRSVAEVLGAADDAMYRAKRSGGARFAVATLKDGQAPAGDAAR